jgi:hypothetical protein
MCIYQKFRRLPMFYFEEKVLPAHSAGKFVSAGTGPARVSNL